MTDYRLSFPGYPPAMPKYTFFVCNKCKRIKYPKSFYLADVESARQVAGRIARAFGEVVPGWSELSSDQQNNFAVEAVDEVGQTVLTLPFDEAEQSKSEPDNGNTRPAHKEAPPGLLN
jgi:hypothetical protein